MREPADDDTLLAAVRGGDRAAFDALYDRYGRPRLRVRRAGHRRRPRRAEDLVQEAFVGAFRGAHGFRGGSGLLTWLLAIAHRRWRDKRRRPRPPTAAAPLADAAEVQATTRPDAGGALPGLAAVARRRRVAPEAHRDAFLLVTVQELTYTEAARVLAAPRRRCAGGSRRRIVGCVPCCPTLTDDIMPDTPEGFENHEPRNAAEATF
jgi:RNA polymerase sigma-70 factor (ECF subfamily)